MHCCEHEGASVVSWTGVASVVAPGGGKYRYYGKANQASTGLFCPPLSPTFTPAAGCPDKPKTTQLHPLTARLSLHFLVEAKTGKHTQKTLKCKEYTTHSLHAPSEVTMTLGPPAALLSQSAISRMHILS